jgi:hypothetical protein
LSSFSIPPIVIDIIMNYLLRKLSKLPKYINIMHG